MEAAAASGMDFHTLSRRELQALCKRNGVRANMTNAAMADALQGLTSVDGIDEIGTTLCLPTPGRSTMKSAAKANAMAVAGEEQQHGSPLPRGRRVSVMSPAAFRMDVEEGDDELKRDLVKKIVKTPGVALRSTSRRARATPAPLPTPVTLRRSQRTAARKAAVPVEVESRVEEMSTAKRATRRASVRSKMILDLDQEEEVAVVATKEQQEEPKYVAPDVKCDDPAEEEAEVTKLLEGNNKEKEQVEADSYDAANGSALLSENGCDDLKVEEMLAVEQDTTGPQDGTVEEQELISVQKSASLARMDDSPILGVLSKDEATESVIEIAQDASVENDEGIAEEWSPVNNMIVETDPDVEDKVEIISEVAVKVDGFIVTGETVYSPKEIVPTATKEDETNEEDLTEEKAGSADEMRQAELTEEETSDELDEDEEWASDDDEASDSTDEIEEGDCIEVRTNFNNVNEELIQMMQGTAIAVEDSEDSVAEVSEDSVEDVSEDGLADEEEVSEDGSADEEEASEDGSASEEASEDGSADEEVSEEDDFTSALPPEFDNIVVFSDAETESGTASPVKENQVAIESASKTSVKSMNDSAICVTNNEEVSEEKDVIEEAMKEVGNNVDTIVKSLHECTIKERTQQAEEEKLNIKVDAVGQKGKQMEDYNTMSMRKLKATLKNHLSSKQGKKGAEAKRLPLEEVDDINACVDC